MLERLDSKDFTVFRGPISLEFGAINIIHGASGTGKTHLLHLIHAAQGTNSVLLSPVETSGTQRLAELKATVERLSKGNSLVWDLPETGLSPALLRDAADMLLALARRGVQVFLGTHSLFLLRELELLQHTSYMGVHFRYFGLHRGADDGVTVLQNDFFEGTGPCEALEQELEQCDRYLNLQWDTGAKT